MVGLVKRTVHQTSVEDESCVRCGAGVGGACMLKPGIGRPGTTAGRRLNSWDGPSSVLGTGRLVSLRRVLHVL
jgi:hypothetical protein